MTNQAAIKIKFGKAENGYDRSDDVSYDLLARRGSQDWQRIGQVEASKTCTTFGSTCGYDEYKIGDFSASLWTDDEDVEVEVEVLSGGYGHWHRKPVKQIRTIAEAKRIIKAWAAQHLEDLNWTGATQ